MALELDVDYDMSSAYELNSESSTATGYELNTEFDYVLNTVLD